MNSNEKTSDLERGWILKNDVLVNDPRWKELADNYNIVGWTDFVENPEEYSDKIRVILQSSTLNLPLDEQVLEKLPNVRVSDGSLMTMTVITNVMVAQKCKGGACKTA